MKQAVTYYELEGTHKEIGRQLAKAMGPGAVAMKIPAPAFFTDKEVEEAIALYDKYCPGIKDELEGFAEEAKMDVKEIAFTWMSYLVPRCSGIILRGDKMMDGHTRLARNYEFSVDDEDLTVCKIKAEGSYTHLGGSCAVFGRTEGINEWGLAVSMSSCGIPVSNIQGMRPAKVKGLQFWAVIRGLLDNCKNVEEALKLAMEMPIAFNINLYLADAKGNGVLLETIDGHKGYKKITKETVEDYLCGANHAVLPEVMQYEPVGMRNSIVRQQTLDNFLEKKDQIEEEEVRKLLVKKYPDGLSAYYYKEWFGTIKSVVMDTVTKRYSICWFGQENNGWEDYFVDNALPLHVEEKNIEIENSEPGFFEMIPIPINK